MATTVQQIFYKVRSLLDEYSTDGVLIPDADVADMQAKSILLADMAQKELFRIGNHYKTYQYTQKPPENLVQNGFDLEEYDGSDKYYPSEDGIAGVYAYYIEVDGDCTVYIQEQQSGVWTTIVTRNITGTGEMVAYKGVIVATDTTNPVRMLVSGTEYFRHQNRAMFDVPYSAARVPDYRPWVKVSLPSDFMALDCVVSEYPTKEYTKGLSYKKEGFKDYYVAWDYEGALRFVYKPVPTTLSAITDTIEVDDIAAQAIVYYVAAKLAPYENQSLTNFFEQKYEEIRAMLSYPDKAEQGMVVNMYG